MPPPVTRPTVASAIKASLTEEKKRSEKENDNIHKYKKKTTSGLIPCTTQRDFLPQKEKKNNEKYEWTFGDTNRQNSVAKTGMKTDSVDRRSKDDKKDDTKKGRKHDTDKLRGSGEQSVGATSSHKDDKKDDTKKGSKHDTDKLRDSGEQSVGATSSHKSGDKKGTKDVTNRSRDGSGKSSQASGTDKVSHPSSTKRQVVNTQNWYIDVQSHGYAKISAAQAKIYHANLDFYRNDIRSKPPPGHTVEDMLKWKGNYGMLERNHSYIQWLFPIPEGSGLNMYAQQLFEHEAQAIRDDDVAHKRVLRAFKMMLDFYGMQLSSSVHGTVKRSDKGWEDRYNHLNRSRHNYLRITRILKSIGELGYERFQAPWVHFLIDEAVIKRVLPNLNGSCLIHWINAVKDDGEKEILFRKANGLPINIDSNTYDVNSEDENEDLSSVNLGNDEIQSKEKKESVTQDVDTEVPLLRKKIDAIDIAHDAGKSDVACAVKEDKMAIAKSQQNKQLQSGQLPCDNLKFYQNNLVSRPTPGFIIETMLRYKGQYEFFENYPYFIHWLFPTPEKILRNPDAQPLLDHEAEAIRNDDVMRSRFLQAYIMMLDFFGMRLIGELDGKIERVPKKYKQRYKHLDTHRHNYLRITRILVSLGELGFERFQVPLIEFFIKEGIENKMIQTLKGSCVMHWINSIKDDGEKQAMFKKYQQLAVYNADINSESSEEEDNVDMKRYNDDYGQARDSGARPPSEAIDHFMAGENINF